LEVVSVITLQIQSDLTLMWRSRSPGGNQSASTCCRRAAEIHRCTARSGGIQPTAILTLRDHFSHAAAGLYKSGRSGGHHAGAENFATFRRRAGLVSTQRRTASRGARAGESHGAGFVGIEPGSLRTALANATLTRPRAKLKGSIKPSPSAPTTVAFSEDTNSIIVGILQFGAPGSADD